jgi:ERF superfamily protein
MANDIVAQSSAMATFIERAALDPAFDVAKLEQLLRMQREVAAEQAKREFNAAMSSAQAEMLPVIRDATNTHTGSKYAKLATIDAEMRPIYTKWGFSVRYGTAPPPRDNWIRVMCTVAHSGGYEEPPIALDAPMDVAGAQGRTNKTGIQAVGSSVSYLRRYLLTMAFNIVLADDPDDDGEAGRTKWPDRQSARSDPPPPQGEATEGPHPLEEQNGDRWLTNLQRLLAGAKTVTDVIELRRDRRVVRVLAPATGNPPEIRRQIEDAFRAAHERLARVGEEPDPRDGPPDDPLAGRFAEIEAMDLITIAGLATNAEWRAKLRDLFPPDWDRVEEAIEARKASLQRNAT